MPKKTAQTKLAATRQLKTPKYQSFRLQKRIKTPDVSKMPGAFQLFMASIRLLMKNWKLFGGIAIVYGLGNLLLVQGLSGAWSTENANLDSNSADTELGSLLNNLMLFTYMAGSGNVNSEAASAYQIFLTIITSLAVIWALREVYAGNKVRIRDAFYRSMHPLVPYFIVLAIVTVQLVPVVIGAFLYGLVNSASLTLTGVEVLFWAIIFGLSVLISLYMLSSSLMALYVVCLAETTPLTALRSARELVRNRRWEVMRKVIFLPIAMFLSAAIIVVPLIFIAPVVAGIVFFLLSMMVPAVAHSYLYRVYRELLG
jgi:hypothetical protein